MTSEEYDEKEQSGEVDLSSAQICDILISPSTLTTRNDKAS